MHKRYSSDKVLLVVIALLWVWCVYRFTVGMGAIGTQNVFLGRMYEWLTLATISIVCFVLFLVVSKKVTRKFTAVVGGFVCVATISLQLMSPIGVSTDYYRYIWQGRVSNAGQDNYSLTPWDAGVEKANDELFERMDWRDVKSVYPPLAEQYFRLHAGIFDSNVLSNISFQSRLGLSKLPNLLLYLVCAYLIYGITTSKRYALFWLLCPLVQFELLNSAHIDALSITLILGAIYMLQSKKPIAHVLAGAFVASAGMVKLTPFVLVVPMAAYVYVSHATKHVSMFIAAFLGVIGLTIHPFIDKNFALIHRIGFWLSGDEFHIGNPLYELFDYISVPILLLKVMAIVGGLVVTYFIFLDTRHKALGFEKMLKFCLYLLALSFIAAPIVLPWYWLTPLTVLLVLYALKPNVLSQRSSIFVGLYFLSLVMQYVDRSVSLSRDIRLWAVVLSALITYVLTAIFSLQFFKRYLTSIH